MVQATHGNLCLCTRPPSQHGLLLQAGSYSSLSSGSPPGALHRLLPLPATLPPQPLLPSTHTCSSCTHTCTHISYIHAPVHTLLLHTAPVHTHTPPTHTDTHTFYTHRHSHLHTCTHLLEPCSHSGSHSTLHAPLCSTYSPPPLHGSFYRTTTAFLIFYPCSVPSREIWIYSFAPSPIMY